MIIRFYNLGKIKETTLDLRPLTVIIGPNNSNKTYIAYSVYGLWHEARRRSFSLDKNLDEKQALQIKSGGMFFSLNVEEQLNSVVRDDIEAACNRFNRDLETFYQDSSGKLFSNTRFHIDISDYDLSQAFTRLAGVKIEAPHLSYILKYNGESLQAEGQLLDEVQANSAVLSSRSLHEALEEELGVIGYILSYSLFPQPFLLPAERNAFVITYKMLANRRYKALREGVRQALGSRESAQRQLDLLREGGEVRYPQPVEDFLDFLTDVEAAKPPNTRSPFAKLADTIESSIQNTNRTRYRPTALGGKEIITQVEKGLDIDLYNASSSIKQLAPLLLYLRYRAKENDLLIIDEPEMNLHPESQAKLLEVLAMLVNHGVNVLLTTHSPYLMAHLNNLTQADDTSQAVRNRQAKSLYLKQPDSLLRMDQVSAYEMRDNQLHSLKDPDYGIRWDTLSNVAADLQQRYFAIYEEGHAKERARNGRKTAAQKNGQKERQPAGGQDGPDQP